MSDHRHSPCSFILAIAAAFNCGGFGHCQPPPPKPGDVMMEKFLAAETARLGQRTLDGARTLEEWQARKPRLQQEFLDMLGLWPLPEKSPLKATVTGTVDQDEVVIEKLHFQSKPGLYVTGNLYRPKARPERKLPEKLPTILLQVGHYNMGRNGHKVFMQDHGMWFAKNGYICLITDTLTRGEIPGEHLGTYREGRWWWQARGYTPAGVECWNGIRALDYLTSRSDVDASRLAVTGLSGGGANTFWIAAVDERVRCAVPASGMTDWESNVTNKIANIHCDCMFPINTYGWEFTTVAALIAPRPLLFVNSDDDLGFPMAANRRIMSRLRPLYQWYGKPDLLDEFVSKGPPGAHAYMPDSRFAIFKWLNKHLKNESGDIPDVVAKTIPQEDLRVFPNDKDRPSDALNNTIDESFVPAAQVKLPEAAKFDEWKQGLLKELRARSFRTFPERIPISDKAPTPGVYNWPKLLDQSGPQTRTTEVGIEVTLLRRNLDDPSKPRENPAVIVVLDADEELKDLPEWAKVLVASDDPCVILAPRGTGPSRFTRTPPYVERAHALLGRTVDQGRVWDIAATAHWLEGNKGVKVIGRGQAGVLAAYAALFEPSIKQLVLVEPPASHRTGPIFLNVLRVLDIPEALGLLAPRSLTLIDAKDRSFERTTAIYQLAGAERKLQRK